jgi:hypothetical protein
MDPDVHGTFIPIRTLRKVLLYSTYSCSVPLSIKHDKIHKGRKSRSPAIISIPNLVIVIVLQSTIMFFVDRMVNLYVFGTTRTTPSYMFKKEVSIRAFHNRKERKIYNTSDGKLNVIPGS